MNEHSHKLHSLCPFDGKWLLAIGLSVIPSGIFSGGASSQAVAQCGCAPAYTVIPQTVMEEHIEQRMRPVWDLEYVEQEITQYRPVLKERTETQRQTVRRPVVETSTVEERYTVKTPVTRRDWVDQSYQETSFVTETSEREESYLSYRPVQETHYQTQSHVVQRPVVETQYQTQQYTTYQPVTNYHSAVVDQGQYVAQSIYQPGDTRYGLRWMGGGLTTNEFGQTGFRRGGLGWVPYTSPGTMQAQVFYQPNPVQVTVPQTTLMPQVQQVQVPVQVTRMQNEVVQTQVPYNVTRMEPVYESRKVPVTVQKPVTQTMTRKVPVDRVEWVEQVMVRPKTIERTSYKLETIEQPVTVRYYENEAFPVKVRTPRRVLRYEPYEVRVRTPRVVQSPVVLSYSDPYSASSVWSAPVVNSTSSPGTSSDSVPNVSERVTYGAAKPVVEPEGGSVDSSPSDAGNGAADRASQKPEMVDLPEPESQGDEKQGDLELNPSADDKAESAPTGE